MEFIITHKNTVEIITFKTINFWIEWLSCYSFIHLSIKQAMNYKLPVQNACGRLYNVWIMLSNA